MSLNLKQARSRVQRRVMRIEPKNHGKRAALRAWLCLRQPGDVVYLARPNQPPIRLEFKQPGRLPEWLKTAALAVSLLLIVGALAMCPGGLP